MYATITITDAANLPTGTPCTIVHPGTYVAHPVGFAPVASPTIDLDNGHPATFVEYHDEWDHATIETRHEGIRYQLDVDRDEIAFTGPGNIVKAEVRNIALDLWRIHATDATGMWQISSLVNYASRQAAIEAARASFPDATIN